MFRTMGSGMPDIGMEGGVMRKTLLIYESKYGSTEELTKKMALVLGPALYCKPGEFKSEFRDCDFIVIGAPVYAERIDKRMYDFVSENSSWLRNKDVALFCTCLAGEEGKKYLDPLIEILGDSILWAKPIGGRLKLGKLDMEDYDSMKRFSEISGLPFQDIDRLKWEQIADCALEIKHIRDKRIDMPENELKDYVEKFIESHNTCTLSTGYGGRVRGTPIEYNYQDGYMYFISEGGEKFANIILNKYVSISICDPYKGMSELGGMQISGTASIIDPGDGKYKEMFEAKGINAEKLPFLLNLIEVKLGDVEFLWSKFRDIGCDIKQHYGFN